TVKQSCARTWRTGATSPSAPQRGGSAQRCCDGSKGHSQAGPRHAPNGSTTNVKESCHIVAECSILVLLIALYLVPLRARYQCQRGRVVPSWLVMSLAIAPIGDCLGSGFS